MAANERICDRCGRVIEGPGSVAADEGQDLCLACVHPVYRGREPAA